MRRANEKIAETIRSGKKPRRNRLPLVINPYEALGLTAENRWVAAPRERESGIAARINGGFR